MDSLTHLVAGAAIVALVAPPARRRAALLVGAIAGSLPDLDNLVLAFADPVARFVEHRSGTHSLLAWPLIALLAFAVLRLVYRPTREAPWRWFAALLLAGLSHILLDAATVYGTRLFWPFDDTPVMGSLLFIIDPAFTLPLLVGVVAAYVWRAQPKAGAWLALALAVSGAYLGWAALAKASLTDAVQAHFDRHGVEPRAVLTTPTPFNTLVWRVVVMLEGGHLEGYYSFLGDRRFWFEPHPSGQVAPPAIDDSAELAALRDFTRGFYRIDLRDDAVEFVDLRMGADPDYVFRFVVGEKRDGGFVPVQPARQVEVTRADLVRSWQRFAPMLAGASRPAG